MHTAERKTSGKGSSRGKGPRVEMCLGCLWTKKVSGRLEHGVEGRVKTKLEVGAGPTASRGLVGFLPGAKCLFVLGEADEGRKQTGVETECLCGRLVLALRLKTKF